VKLGRGAVVVVELDPTLGHEQHGVRPCIVVSDPDVVGDQRFPLLSALILLNVSMWFRDPLSVRQTVRLRPFRETRKPGGL
jgi:mRNA-degrading endonuclease toxin of MazEF toxin-antitoxin module